LAVSPTKIKSTNFIIETAGENLVFKGSGFGHGVGLSQWGAKKMAEDGFNYKEILEFYYPNTEIGKAY
jgi:stage II sporulation protein D